jgi:hypothetical protein
VTAAQLRCAQARALAGCAPVFIAGPAVVRLRDDRAYVGHAFISGVAVTMLDAQLRHRDVAGTRLYPRRSQTWPLHVVAAIEWTRQEKSA